MWWLWWPRPSNEGVEARVVVSSVLRPIEAIWWSKARPVLFADSAGYLFITFVVVASLGGEDAVGRVAVKLAVSGFVEPVTTFVGDFGTGAHLGGGSRGSLGLWR